MVDDINAVNHNIITIHNIKTKCIPVLLYGLEALQLNVTNIFY